MEEEWELWHRYAEEDLRMAETLLKEGLYRGAEYGGGGIGLGEGRNWMR
jgi:HEPN domain-containing protein